MLKSLFSFPNPVNEVAARFVAGGVVTMSLVAIIFQFPWLVVLIAYGFIARTLTGPALSPLGQLVTRIIVPAASRWPRFAPKLVAGPPKRLAQTMGAVMSITATVLVVATDHDSYGYAILGVLVVAAGLESFFGYCLGCKIFYLLMRVGLIPEKTCEACNNILLTADLK